MVLPLLLKELAEEKIILLKPAATSKLPFRLEGIVRLVDQKGNTLGLVLDREALEDLEEEMEAQNPEFLASLEKSRKSGRVSGKALKKKARL